MGWHSLSSKDQLVLKKIQQHIESILRYCQGVRNFQQFQSDSMLVEATVFNLMQIGEPAKVSLSDEAKAQLTAIPWPQLYGMRNRIVHGYAGVNMNIVWDTIQMDRSVPTPPAGLFCPENRLTQRNPLAQ